MREKEEVRYTMKEIEVASGIKASTLQGRRKRLGISSNRGGYTVDEVKKLIKRPPMYGHNFSQRKADALRALLKNDGAI